jgi:hypothetical protein
MPSRKNDVWGRLAVGLLLNIALFCLTVPHIGKSSGIENDVRESLIGGILALATWVFVIPVFWRGVSWQVPLAFVLIFFLPGLALFHVGYTLIHNW